MPQKTIHSKLDREEYTDDRFPGFLVVTEKQNEGEPVIWMEAEGQKVYTFDTNRWFRGRDYVEGVFDGMKTAHVLSIPVPKELPKEREYKVTAKQAVFVLIGVYLLGFLFSFII